MKLTEADRKFLVNKLGLFEADSTDLKSEEKKHTRENRFSGERVAVTAVVAKLIDLVYGISEEAETNTPFSHPGVTRANCVQYLDRARGIVLKLDSGAYMSILD